MPKSNAERQKVYRSKRVKEYKKLGLCKCGKRPIPGRKNCRHCVRLARIYNKKATVKRYGLTVEEWTAIWDMQEGKCAICGDRLVGGPGCHTDHVQTTGKVRGILCYMCNPLIGYARERADILEKAIVYLTR